MNKVLHVLMHVIVIGDMGLPACPGEGVSNVKEFPWNVANFDIVLLQTLASLFVSGEVP